MSDPKMVAATNIDKLRGNPYPGRLIVVGTDEAREHIVFLYAIMGRSENSRNRIMRSKMDMSVYTEAIDPAKVKDPKLIIYNALLERRRANGDWATVVSNGRQTDAIADGFVEGKSFEEILCAPEWSYEPDTPNYTPRITAAAYWNPNSNQVDVKMAILRKSPTSDECMRDFYSIDDDVPQGFGYCIHTYEGDGDPLPSFRGEPFLVPLPGVDDKGVGDFWWDTVLNRENRVSLVVVMRTPTSRLNYICNASGIYKSVLS